MKKAYTLSKTSLLAMFMILSVVFACKDDDKDDPTPPSTDPIVATWQLTAITPTTTGVTLPDLTTLINCIYSLKLTFKSDNTLATADCPLAVATIDAYVPITGSKWKVDGENVTFTNESKNITKTFKHTIVGTELQVFVDGVSFLPGSPAVSVVLKFKKV